jgi:hypothetical protein
LEVNVGNTASPSYVDVLGANREVRWHDTSTVSLTTPSASWPYVTRPTSGTAGIDYAYAATADTTLEGIYSGAGTAPAAFANGDYLWGRWNWDAVGTFASAPIFTAYPTTAHGSISRGDGSLLGGHASDTGATARSYLKANALGQVGAATAAPSNAPTVTDGSTGSVSPTAGNNWLTNYQGLMGDSDYISFPSTPAATTAAVWHAICRLFTGANMTPGTYANTLSLRYTYT